MRILLLSAYHTDSHQSWCEGLMAQFPEYEWTLLSLPGRYFSWRIRGNALSWAMGDFAELNAEYDLLLATSMVDLASLRGLKPHLARARCILYMHENQFAYPPSSDQHSSVEPAMVNLYSALAADSLIFNSAYNRDTFFQGAEQLLRKLPDHAPLSLLTSLRNKSSVLPVALNLPQAQPARAPGSPLRIIWNHRWEYDKGPDTLAALISLSETAQLPFEFYLLGRQFRQTPPALQRVLDTQPACVKHQGFASRTDYLRILQQGHVALSTALHEFQGLALLEAAAMGNLPLAPARLAYPEWLPADYLYADQQGQALKEAEAIKHQLLGWQQQPPASPHHAHLYLWSQLRVAWAQALTPDGF